MINNRNDTIDNNSVGLYVNYGCGLKAPSEWINFDASPTLRLQKIPFLGNFFSKHLNVIFPKNIRYGDIVKGLPGIKLNSCKGIFCSHVLEHLSFEEFQIALKNTFKILSEEGIFRCVVPDLESAANVYINDLKNKDPHANSKFFKETGLGYFKKKKGIKESFVFILGNAQHLFMWDRYSLHKEIEKIGFKHIRQCSFNDCSDKMFQKVEDEGRFNRSIAFEATK